MAFEVLATTVVTNRWRVLLVDSESTTRPYLHHGCHVISSNRAPIRIAINMFVPVQHSITVIRTLKRWLRVKALHALPLRYGPCNFLIPLGSASGKKADCERPSVEQPRSTGLTVLRNSHFHPHPRRQILRSAITL